ncbi:choline ABC transporter permease, partial [Listeria monocytogenes]
MIKYLTDNASALLEKTLEQLYISVFALLIAIIIAIPLVILLSKTDKLSKISLTIAG